MKKLLSFLLLLTMVMGCVPVLAETAPATIINFADGNCAFLGVDTSAGNADACSLAVVDYAGGKALHVDVKAKVPYIALNIEGLLGENYTSLAAMSFDVGVELGSDGKFYSQSGKVYTVTGADQLKTGHDWSVYMKNKNPKTARVNFSATLTAGIGEYLLITKETDTFVDSGRFPGEAPRDIYLTNLQFFDAQGNALPLDLTAEWVSPNAEADLSNLSVLTGAVEFPGFTCEAGGWSQSGFSMPEEFRAALVPGSVIEISFESANGTCIAGSPKENLTSPEINGWDVCRFLYREQKVALTPIAAWILRNFDDYAYKKPEIVPLELDMVFVDWPVGPSGNAETNAAKSTSATGYMIPVGVEDPLLVYNVLYDVLNWYGYDPEAAAEALDIRDNEEALGWWYGVTAKDIDLQEHNFNVMYAYLKDGTDNGNPRWWGGFYTRNTDFDISAVMSGCDPEGKAYLDRDIKAIAEQLLRLQEAGVPVLWRPLHESSGGWFWWGAKGAEPFKQLWIYLFNELTYTYGCNNLIWIWNARYEDWYPGDEYVDIIGEDVYADAHDYNAQNSLFFEVMSVPESPKLLALTEVGVVPDIDQLLLTNARWLWFNTWGGDYVYK